MIILSLLLLLKSISGIPNNFPTDGRVSVDVVDALWSRVPPSTINSTESKAVLCSACSRGFTSLRFAALPFWPRDMNISNVTVMSNIWTAFDSLIVDAKSCNCTLIPSLFWNIFVLPDLFNESLSLLMDTSQVSKARDAQDVLTNEFLTRYNNESIIVAWELTNELNLLMDTNISSSQPLICVACGTPPKRTLADNISTSMAVSWQSRLANMLRSTSSPSTTSNNNNNNSPIPSRLISSGHSIARPAARWLRESFIKPIPGPSWVIDTPLEFGESTALQNVGVDILSAHIYADHDNGRWDHNTLSLLPLQTLFNVSIQLDMIFWLAEFGDNKNTSVSPHIWAYTVLNELATWPTHQSRWSASVWVWSFIGQTNTFSFGPEKEDEEFVQTLQKFNSRQ